MCPLLAAAVTTHTHLHGLEVDLGLSHQVANVEHKGCGGEAPCGHFRVGVLRQDFLLQRCSWFGGAGFFMCERWLQRCVLCSVFCVLFLTLVSKLMSSTPLGLTARKTLSGKWVWADWGST